MQVLGFEVDLLLILRCTSFSVSDHWQIGELYNKLHAKMLLMRILLSNVHGKWKLPFLLSSTVQATLILSFETSGGKCDT